MGIHRPPAHVDSSLLLQYCCHNPRGNNPCSFEEAEVAEVPIKTLHDSSKFSRIGQPSEFARSCALYFVNTKSFPRIHSSFDFTFFLFWLQSPALSWRSPQHCPDQTTVLAVIFYYTASLWRWFLVVEISQLRLDVLSLSLKRDIHLVVHDLSISWVLCSDGTRGFHMQEKELCFCGR